MFNNLKNSVALVLFALTLALAGSQSLAHANHAQPDDGILVADGECPNGDPGTCGSSGGGG